MTEQIPEDAPEVNLLSCDRFGIIIDYEGEHFACFVSAREAETKAVGIVGPFPTEPLAAQYCREWIAVNGPAIPYRGQMRPELRNGVAARLASILGEVGLTMSISSVVSRDWLN
jgi:hypothetical protein